ncbi:Tn5253 hypothetical protein [Streptococcus pneumoniae]|uniref:hypothetical protein n=1 Tax=Streptococcus pneumoniae TaxID=1313 RepID=UPI0005E9346F|nr:hypothetical protein [Streptococcus pneumoniae]CIZ14784.1 Tn5253 hypothetical protein [Streptococcus pneumoniae]
MAERFWENLSIILAERNISCIELTRKMFAGEFHYPSELNRLYQKIRFLGFVPFTWWFSSPVFSFSFNQP